MAKKVNEIANGDLKANIVILRSVYGKTCKYTIQPCVDPKTGRFPDHVKPVDSNGDIRLSDSEKEKEANGEIVYIKQNATFEVQDGTTYDLNDVYQKAIWDAIKNCRLIAQSRTERDANGNLKIDGNTKDNTKTARIGDAELYIDRPGLATQQKLTKKKKQHNAISHILDDSADGRLLKAKLLGRDMRDKPDADVEDFLIQRAEINPDEVIAIYTGDDIQLRLLLIEAKEKHVINYKNKTYLYGENVIAATDEAVITWMKQARNKNLVELIRRDTYPELES